MKTRAEQKRSERTEKRRQGFVLKQFWIFPKDWPRAKRYLDRLNDRN
jgi:hypothetical protein